MKFNLQFDLKLEVKRQNGRSHQRSISTFNLQFDLKLEVKRQNNNATQEGVPRLTSSLTSN